MSRAGGAIRLFVLMSSAALCLPQAWAQTTTAAITGTIRTQQGSPLPGAVVQARSESTGAVRTAVADAEGRYRIDLLEPGTWKVWGRIEGGVAGEARVVTLRLQQTLILDFTVGPALSETVTVFSVPPLVDTARTGGELRVEGGQADELPLAGRVVTDLALLDASVRPTPPGNFYGERGSVFVVNGQSGRANSFLVDGLDNNDRTSGTTLNGYFSQQVIREFVVLTRQYAPEFGRAGGGILNIITERGENDPQGEVFFQGVAGGLNPAGHFVSSLPQREGLQETSGRFQTGFRFGGPLQRDRAFYFVAYEHQQSDDVVPYTGVGRDGRSGGWMVAPSRDDNLFLRGDFNLAPAHTLMLRLSADDRTTGGLNVGGETTPETGFELDERDFQIAASLTSVISPTLMNEVRVLVGTSSFEQSANSDRPGVERPSGTFGGNNLNRQDRGEDLLQIVENLTWRAGRHTPKAGIDLARSQTRIRTRFNPSGNFLYDTDLPFEAGDCGDLLISQVDPNDPFAPIPCPGNVGVDDDGDGVIDEPGLIGTYPFVYQLIEGRPSATLDDTRVGVFLQDAWQAGERLLLDYGVRYDLNTFQLPSGTRIRSRIDNGGAERDRNDIAPRVGFAFTPDPSGRAVIRGGAGIFYDKLVLGFPAVAAITSGTRIGLTFPQGFTFEINEDLVEQFGVQAVKQALGFPRQLTLFFSTGSRLETPYSVQYSLGGERAVGTHGSVSANVTRALGYHQVLLRDLNPVVNPDPNALVIPVHRDPNVGSIAAFVTEGRSWYTGLDLGWRWRGEARWYSVSYTWSKALDLGPDPLKGGIALPPNAYRGGLPVVPASDDLSMERGRSDSDRRHRLVLAGASGLPWMGLRASGVIQAASGAPFNVTTGRDENLDGITSDRPPGVGRNTGADTSLASVNALRGRAGLTRIGSLEEPFFVQVDTRLSKVFPVRGGKGSGEVFLQVFNLLNRFNGGPVDGAVTSREFSRPVGQAGPPRTLEIGLKMGFSPAPAAEKHRGPHS